MHTYVYYFFSHWKELGLFVKTREAGDIQDEMDYIAVSDSIDSFKDVDCHVKTTQESSWKRSHLTKIWKVEY